MLKKIKSYFSFTFEGKDKKTIRKEQLLALLSGLLMGASFPPGPLYFLSFIALVPLFFVWQKRNSLASINRATYFFGLGFTLVTLYWVGSWTKDADPFLMISGTVLIFFNPLLFLIPSTLFHYARKNFKTEIAFWLLPFFWVFYEYIYSLTDLRFPWIVLGHGLAKFQLFIQIADTIGSMGLSFLVVAINGSFFFVFEKTQKEKIKFAVIGLTLLIIPVIYGIVKISNFEKGDKSVRVGLVQPDLNPWKKWEAGNLEDQIKLYTDLSEKAIKENAKIIIWPETGLPVYFRNRAYDMPRRNLHKFLVKNDVSLLTGMPDSFLFSKEDAPEDAKKVPGRDTYYTSYNSLWGLIPESENIQTYQKMLLVPFGEFTPFAGSLPFLREFIQWGVGIGNWNIGKEVKVIKFPERMGNNFDEEIKIGGVICIESIFQGFVTEFVNKGADFISVITNDSWYGNSSGPRQHKYIGVLRAVENYRSVVRCANGGISCIISPIGEIEKETEMFTRDFLVGDVTIKSEITFAKIGRFIKNIENIFIPI